MHVRISSAVVCACVCSGNKAGAIDSFFNSFTGAIVYAHGTPKNLSKGVRIIVALLSDMLFAVVCVHLLQMLACDYSSWPPVLRSNRDMECWVGEHRPLAAIALVAFSLYVPLSIMIGTAVAVVCLSETHAACVRGVCARVCVCVCVCVYVCVCVACLTRALLPCVWGVAVLQRRC